MERDIMKQLVEWKDSVDRKPLLLTGVRQCGKTYVCKQFGERYFEDTAYFYFEGNKGLSSVFDYDFDVDRIIDELGNIIRGKEIIPGKTLVIFDEIQACPNAITSLKYFCENKRELHIVCAGSLLGVAIKRDNILNTVYHNTVSRSVLDDGRYVITFEFKATPEMLNDFETWNVKKGQKMQITYFLKDNLEIDHYDYYIFDKNDKKKNIANVYVNYNSGLKFPDEVINLVNSKDTYSVTLYENYGLGSQYSESYNVPKGSALEINSYLYSYNVYQDPEKKKLWDFGNDVINKDTKLYLYENIYYEVEEETGDTIITREETENE